MSVLKGAANLYFLYKFIRILTTPFNESEAYQLGIIDEKGKILKKKSRLRGSEEKEAYTLMHGFTWKMKRLLEKIPFGKSRLASYAAALWFIKEEKTFDGTDEELQESFLSFLETDWKDEALILKENFEGDMDKKTFSNLREAKRGKLPPHLAKFFDKKGNLKKDAADRVKKGREKRGVKITDRTPDWMFGEKAPPGWEGTVKKMKKHKNIDNPYALAWYMANKGDKPSDWEKHEIGEELDEASDPSARSITSFGRKMNAVSKKGGIDKELYKSIAQSAIEGHLPHPKLIQNMDTEPREAVLSLMGKEFGSKFVEKEYKIKFNNPKNYKEWLEFEEAKDYKYDGKVVKISKKNFRKVHKDFKNSTKGKERMMINDPKTGGSISVPVQFEEVEIDEAKGTAYPATIETLKKIVKDKQNQIVMFKSGQARVDSFSASAMVQVYNAMKPATKKKFEAMIKDKAGFMKTQAFAMKMMEEINYLDESTKEYAKALEKIANDRALKMLTKSERNNLKKIADLLSKERKEEVEDMAGEWGTDKLTKTFKDETPGQGLEEHKGSKPHKHPHEDEVEEGHEKTVCPKCDGEGCDHCDGKGYHAEAKEREISHKEYLKYGAGKDGKQWTTGKGKTTRYWTHRKEEVELDEWKYNWAVIDTADKNRVQALTSDEKGARSSMKSATISKHDYHYGKDPKTLKVVKLKKAHKDNDIGDPLKENVVTFGSFLTEGRPALDPDYVPGITMTDKERTRLVDSQHKRYTEKDIQSIARKHKVKLSKNEVPLKFGNEWTIVTAKGVTLIYDERTNGTRVTGWKLNKNKLRDYKDKYEQEHTRMQDVLPMGGKIDLRGFESAFELIGEDVLTEELPANSTGPNVVGTGDDPTVWKKKKNRKNAKVKTEEFGGKKVFVVSAEKFWNARLGKSRYTRYEKYVGNDKLGEAIRQYGRQNPKAPIILKNSENGAMLYLKYGGRI